MKCVLFCKILGKILIVSGVCMHIQFLKLQHPARMEAVAQHKINTAKQEVLPIEYNSKFKKRKA